MELISSLDVRKTKRPARTESRRSSRKLRRSNYKIEDKLAVLDDSFDEGVFEEEPEEPGEPKIKHKGTQENPIDLNNPSPVLAEGT